MRFSRGADGFGQLERELRALRREPSRRYVRDLADRLQARPQWFHLRVRFVVALALTAAVLAASASANIFTLAAHTTNHLVNVVQHLTAPHPIARVNGPMKPPPTPPSQDPPSPSVDQYAGTCGPAPRTACVIEVDPDKPAITEGNSGTTPVTFTLSLKPSGTVVAGGTVCVTWSLSNGTATLGSDYSTGPGPQPVCLGPGDSSVTVTPAAIIGDTIPESDETFTVHWTPDQPWATMDGDDFHNTVTIKNDDGPVSSSAVKIQPTCTGSVNQPTSGTTTITCSVSLDKNAPAGGIDVSYSTEDDTATAGDDYTAIPPTTMTFAAGTKGPQTFTITILGEATKEPDQVFYVNFASGSSNAVVSGSGHLKVTVKNQAP